ncbi:hypothetical protein [Marinifilum flexuosum]|uniref:hypothetical protein n=1 Tax=Marinifilum flexuosum TaxID=1117708 RepID=UPI002493E6E3|nr:hypothetical protein [Marinifilum flexuosum]
MSKFKEIKLNQFQLNVLLDEEEKAAYDYIVQEGTYCVHCKEMCTKGVDVKENFLNDMNDILIKGTCKICNGRVSRFIEYGEFDDFREKALRFRISIGAE